jgi:hypothetical protein
MKSLSRLLVQGSVYTFAGIGAFLVLGYGAIRLGITKTEGAIDTESSSFVEKKGPSYTLFPLSHSEEWVAFRVAVSKDEGVLEEVSRKTGVPSRVLIALLVPEQMRLYYTNRPLFKEIFAPLRILGSQSQFSWGIMGIKDETAREVEANLKDSTSPFYLGKSYEHMLDFKTADEDEERFQRIINEKDHTYSYLYAALYILQVEKQWKDAGVDIHNRPGIVATLWNIGFENSKPHSDPLSGGSTMEISGQTYTFGGLAQSFYDSDEMVELFPQE